MPNTLQEIIFKISATKKIVERNSNPKTADDSVRFVTGNYLYNEQVKLLADKLIANFGDNLLTSIKNITPERLFDESMVKEIHSRTLKVMRGHNVDSNLIKKFDEKIKEQQEIYQKSEKSPEDLDAYYKNVYFHFEGQEEQTIYDSLKFIYPLILSNIIKDSKEEEIDNELYQNILYTVHDSSVFTEDDIADTPDKESLDTHPLENDIEELKELDEFKDDPEVLDLLDDINNFIVNCDLEQKDYQSILAEKYGDGCSYQIKDIINEQMSEEEKNFYEIDNDSTTLKLNDDSLNGKLKALNKSDFEYVETSKETQDKLIELSNKMEEAGITKNVPFVGETGMKEYAFLNMLAKRNEVIKAIKNKDKEAIKTNAKEMFELKDAHNEILSDIKKYSKSQLIGANISSSRNQVLPFEYRKDFINVTKSNALFLAKTFANTYQVKFEDLVKNPVKTFIDGADNFKRNNGAANYFKENSKDMNHLLHMLSKPSDEFFNIVTLDNACFRDSFRVLQAFATFENNQAISEKLYHANNSAHMYWVTLQNDLLDTVKTGAVYDPVNMIANFVTAKGDDFSPYIFSPEVKETIDINSKKQSEPFNRINSIKKSNSKELLDGMIQIKGFESNKFTSDDVKDGLKLAAEDIIKSNIPLTKNDEHILKYFKKGKDIPKLFIDNLNNEELLSEIKEKGIPNKDSLKAIILNIADNQKSYENTSNWNKVFHREYRDQRDIANSLMDELIAKTNDKESIEKVINLAKEGKYNKKEFNQLLSSVSQKLSIPEKDNNFEKNLGDVFDHEENKIDLNEINTNKQKENVNEKDESYIDIDALSQ